MLRALFAQGESVCDRWTERWQDRDADRRIYSNPFNSGLIAPFFLGILSREGSQLRDLATFAQLLKFM